PDRPRPPDRAADRLVRRGLRPREDEGRARDGHRGQRRRGASGRRGRGGGDPPAGGAAPGAAAVIVRGSGEGQWRVPDDQQSALNALDNQIVEALESCSQEEFSALLRQLIEATIEAGERVGDDEVLPSDVVLPARDTTLDEARELFAGE